MRVTTEITENTEEISPNSAARWFWYRGQEEIIPYMVLEKLPFLFQVLKIFFISYLAKTSSFIFYLLCRPISQTLASNNPINLSGFLGDENTPSPSVELTKASSIEQISPFFFKTLRGYKSFNWGKEQSKAFGELEEYLNNVVKRPNPGVGLLLYISASRQQSAQLGCKQLLGVFFFSKALSRENLAYSELEKQNKLQLWHQESSCITWKLIITQCTRLPVLLRLSSLCFTSEGKLTALAVVHVRVCVFLANCLTNRRTGQAHLICRLIDGLAAEVPTQLPFV